MTKETVSARIREKRKGQRLTQQELADKIGVSLMTVLRWEKGERTPNILIMPQIAKALNTTVEYLMGLQPDAEESSPEPKANRNVLPGLAYWGGVADNARNVAREGSSEDIADVVQLLKRALAYLGAMNNKPATV